MRRQFGFGLGMSILISATLIFASAVLENVLDHWDERTRDNEEKSEDPDRIDDTSSR